MRAIPVLVLVGLAVLLAGCIGSGSPGDVDPAANDRQPDQRHVQVLVEPVPGPQDREQVSRTLAVPDAVEGLFVDVGLSVQGPGQAEAWLETPEGQTLALAEARTHQGTAVEESLLAPPEPGEWTLHLDTSAPTQLNVELTVHTREPALEPVEPEGPTRPVVAVVDTGVNPYHEAFHRDPLPTDQLPARVLEDGQQAPLAVPVDARETYEASLARDAAVWAHVPDERLVHFQGTNVLGYQLGDTQLPRAPILDGAGHGTSVAHAVTREADAVVVVVRGPDYDDGVRWAASQPWIDLLSLSWGPALNAAGVLEPHAFGYETPEATRQAHDAGKFVFAASGNDPTPTVTDTTTGPPWVHAVSGAQPDSRGRAAMSGNLVDTVANWTQTLAQAESRNGTRTGSGTSFATPTTAGIAARVLDRVRSLSGHGTGIEDGALVATEQVRLTNSDLRDALNRSAVYWNTTDYEGPNDPGPSVPVAPAPWTSMGWGYLDGSRVDVAVEGLVDGELPDKPEGARAWMANHQEARERYWR